MLHPPPGPEDEARVSEKPIPTPTLTAKSEADLDGLAPNCPQGDELFMYVNECFDNGSTKSEVLKQLLAYGYNQDQAETIVDDAARWRYKHSDISRPSADGYGHLSMWIGGGICLLGIVITVGSCMGVGEGGGPYTIAYGAIIWGAIQFFRSMSQSNQQ